MYKKIVWLHRNPRISETTFGSHVFHYYAFDWGCCDLNCTPDIFEWVLSTIISKTSWWNACTMNRRFLENSNSVSPCYSVGTLISRIQISSRDKQVYSRFLQLEMLQTIYFTYEDLMALWLSTNISGDGFRQLRSSGVVYLEESKRIGGSIKYRTSLVSVLFIKRDRQEKSRAERVSYSAIFLFKQKGFWLILS